MIGDRIRELRKKKLLTQHTLAEKLGVSASAIGMYEQNRREPDYDTLITISKLFNVTSDYLLFGEDTHMTSSSFDIETRSGDFDDIIDSLKDKLQTQKGLMFKGEVLTDDDLEKIFRAMKVGAEIALKSNK